MRIIVEGKQIIKYPRYSVVLIALLSIFCFRVFSQLLQKFYPVGFLPPFEDWQSGAVPYWLLVVAQFLIILVCLIVILKISLGRVIPRNRTGKICLFLGAIYLMVMLFRLIVGLTIAPEHSWFGARIPTFFHTVLASFLVTVGVFHYQHGKQENYRNALQESNNANTQ